ncbi:MAG: large subunit ribosomal protein L9, partial [Myxococcota bacterium]
AINEEGFSIDKRQVVLKTAIKNLGVYTVEVKVHGEIVAPVKVWVVSEVTE